ncbi:MFS transporter [Paraoerskovia marina]|uniref:MFS transporter n=1 Tax=Paraoerskovia marina TaxID=545619 RepID=UPI000B1D676F|nr:MFS transporter [Paraoerskovia marina]
MIKTLLPREPVARALTFSTMALAASNGVFYAVSVLYFTRVVGLSATTVGLGLGIAGGAGVLGSFLAGRWADRLGAHRLQWWGVAVQGAALGAYTLATGPWTFVAAAVVAVGARGVHGTARQALIARWFTGPDRVEVRARLRVVMNVFIGLGTLLAATALAVDTAAAYRTAMVVVAVLLLLAVVPVYRLPRRVPALAEQMVGRRRAGHDETGTCGTWDDPGVHPLRDRRYVASVAANSVIAVQFGVLTVGIPLWVASTAAPPVIVSGLLVVNTVLVAMLQVRASRGTHDVRRAGRSVRRGSVLLAAACVLYAAAGYGNVLVACALLVVAAVAHSLAETLAEAGAWGMAFELADPRRAGEYQGLSQTGIALATMAAPVVVTLLPVRYGTPGWLALAAVFLLAGAAAAAVARMPDPAEASTVRG